MDITAGIMLGLAASLDNFLIGMVYGIRNIKIPIISNIVISVLSGIIIAIAYYFGRISFRFLPIQYSQVFSGVLICIIGIWTMVSPYIERRKSEICLNSQEINAISTSSVTIKKIADGKVTMDIDKSGSISIDEAFYLGFALAVNCLGTGFCAGISAIGALGLFISTVVISFISILLGGFLGLYYTCRLTERKIPIISGVILIIVGIFGMIF